MQFADFVEEEGKSLAFARGEHLFRQGDADGSVYVLTEGLLKAYYLLARTRSDLEMADAMVGHLLEFSMKKERREREFLTESAEERYRLLLERSPGLHGQVAQKEIARYLGITPVALSRIRKRISNTD